MVGVRRARAVDQFTPAQAVFSLATCTDPVRDTMHGGRAYLHTLRGAGRVIMFKEASGPWSGALALSARPLVLNADLYSSNAMSAGKNGASVECTF